ncbi:MAG TPA: 1,4-alpha-glucan branching protein GlgB [Myxococcota bacterium]|nr:1,4-alpha-glucan branching protein GlgB [Myxococcota bacterium]
MKRRERGAAAASGPPTLADEVARLAGGVHTDPHRVLGAHAASQDGVEGCAVRAFHPDAIAVECLQDDAPAVAMTRADPRGLFACFLPGRRPPLRYRLRFHFADGRSWQRDDPYRFLPTLGELDLHLIAEGTHRRLWEALGARPMRVDDVDGVSFAVWAPNAPRVSLVGDFCAWDGRLLPMRSLGGSGVFELFVPGVESGAHYKYEIRTREGALRTKADPLCRSMELPPGSASRVFQSRYEWGDADWMLARRRRDAAREPLSIYEVHLGSWQRDASGRPLGYRELAPRLAQHVRGLGFTHVELLPVAEHPFSGSWGYQVTGYYAPTARYGTPDDFRFFVDHLHQQGIGVLLDWVPAHFPRDDFALRRFDGTALYEHADPRRGEHPDWGTLIFDYGRREVRNFLVANALYWLDAFHADGLRVDAVASMLYLDYSRRPGEWTPNARGGRENLDAVEFLRALSAAVAEEQPGCVLAAEESTAWPGVTRAPRDGGLGFSFKWNMGWMHDTLRYFARDPVHRRWHQDELTFAMLYEHSERFLMPLSHDEVVHGKGSLYGRMPGDPWQRLANLRALLAYQWTRPGKKLVFMGTELAPHSEWNHDQALDWRLSEDPLRAGLARCIADLGALYRDEPCLWRRDPDIEGFRWIDCSDRDHSVLAYLRVDGERHVVVVMNLTPAPFAEYRIGVPTGARYRMRLDTDDLRYGGSGFASGQDLVSAEALPWHGLSHSVRLRLPPLAALVLLPEWV